MAKTWGQKLNGGQPAHVEPLAKPMWGAPAGALLFIATPRVVDSYIRSIPSGETRTVAQMREALARENKADLTCPMTASIFARIAAEAALEALDEGADASQVTPFWRLIDAKCPIAKKLSCGADFVALQRRLEAGGMDPSGPPPSA